MPSTAHIAKSYFAGLQSGDLAQIPYAERVELWTPLAPRGLSEAVLGATAVRAFFAAIVPLIARIEVLNVFENGDWRAGRAHIHLANPERTILHVMDIFHVRDGRIVFQENHFDPRAALPAGGGN